MEMGCDLVWREISNYVDGDVEPGMREALEKHFRHCRHCASVLAGTQNITRLYADERMWDAPPGFGQRLSRSIQKRVAGLRSTP